MTGKYHYNFAWESPYGRIVRLLEGRLEAGTVVLDLGCGFGPLAEPLDELGGTYIGCDLDDDGLASLRERGFETHNIDLTDLETVVERILKAVAGRRVGAILMLDTLEHLPDTEGFLSQLREVSVALERPLLGLSIPNVAHFDVGAKLLMGRSDVTPTGLLDRTHLQFFTEDRLSGVLADAGWVEVAGNDFRLHHSDQHFPGDSPALCDGAPLRDLLWCLRQRVNDTATVNQFVRLFVLGVPRLPAATRPEARPFLSVLMRTQGRRMANLLEALTCLAAQTDPDFEVLVLVHAVDLEIVQAVREMVDMFAPDFSVKVRVHHLTEGRRAHPLNFGLDQATGSYLAFLDDDDLVTADWVQRFREGAVAAPSRVVRSITADRRVARPDLSGARSPYVALGPLEMTHAPTFDALEHLYQNRSPICSFAAPLDAVRSMNNRFDEERLVLEDWEFLLAVAGVCGVHDTERVTSIYHRWMGSESSLSNVSAAVWDTTRRSVLQRLDTSPLLLPPGSASRIADLWQGALAAEEHRRARDDIEGRLHEREAEVDRLNSELDRYRAVEGERMELDRVRQLEVSRLQAEIDKLQPQANSAAAAHAEVYAMRNSTSWRLTSPLRRLVTVLRDRSSRRA